MGGDHKCPVCQATFTRPQHVARHMRSHTGDRPYKCQYCGDQFARSDLLARHINKCHANEKPLPNSTSGGRRKGSVATSRATTSKQACDQCVQSSLPCDGSNPCAKCVSRKCRCTYVKFHRQTAPSGPGHHPPHSPSSSTSSLSASIGSSRIPPHPDDFALATPQSAPPLGSPFPGPDQIFNAQFTFSPPAPAYPSNWSAVDIPQLPFAIASDADKYRAQAEALRRTVPAILTTNSQMVPSMYVAQQHQPPSSNWYPAWAESAPYHPLDDSKPLDGIARSHSLASSDPSSFVPEFYGPDLIGSAYRPRRVSLDFSDSSSATSQSLPSSASSSSAHLPLSGNDLFEAHSDEMQRRPDAHILQDQPHSAIPSSQPPPFSASSETTHPPPPQQPHHPGEGGFSSAFGLMSIDDPNVLAGLSSDGVPFFSNLNMGILPHSPNTTPMPARVQHTHLHQGRDRGVSLSALPTPRLPKDADTRELKDVWRTYMRSPLSGSGTAALDLPSTQALSLAQMPQSPSGQRRRVRVSSLPSVTPTMEKCYPMVAHGHGHGHGEAGAGAVMRTTLHGNPEDLRSYEAAVNARSASLKLNLVPRRRGTRPSVTGSPPIEGTTTSSASADHHRISRPSSSSSTSSLAQALAVPASQQQHPHPHHEQPPHTHAPMSSVVKPPPMQGASISLPIPPPVSMSGLHSGPHSHSHSHSYSVGFGGSSTSLTFEPGSRASSVTSDGTGTGGSGSDGEVFRPSFKRYPSQTLGPTSSKRAMVEMGDGESKGVKVDQRGCKPRDRGETRNGEGYEYAGVSAGVDVGPRPIAGLPERAKRG